MPNAKQIEILNAGVVIWNRWRKDHPRIRPDLSRASLRFMILDGVDFHDADLTKADLTHAFLHDANLCGAVLTRATLVGTNFCRARFCDAILTEADLHRANLDRANLSGADLTAANLERALLVQTTVTRTKFSRCRVYGVSAWDLDLQNVTDQSDLRITREGEPHKITVDNLEVAQFVYLLLHNPKIRDAIHTIGRKGVLILGSFRQDKLEILHAIRDYLRERDLLPMIFEFDPLSTEPTMKTLSTLAHLSRFVIADLTQARTVLQELTDIVKQIPTLPVQPLHREGTPWPPFIDSFLILESVLKPYEYTSPRKLVADLPKQVIEPLESRAVEFESKLANIRQKWTSTKILSTQE